jgi:ssRNA-specific RNase YbeY (16S rRNA maturation enzyme)
MNLIDIQRVFETDSQPSDAQLELWVNTILAKTEDDIELTIRIVDEAESLSPLKRCY